MRAGIPGKNDLKQTAGNEQIKHFFQIFFGGCAAIPGIAACNAADSACIEAGSISASASFCFGKKGIAIHQGSIYAVIEQIIDVIFHQHLQKIPIVKNIPAVTSAERMKPAGGSGEMLLTGGLLRNEAILFLQNENEHVFPGRKKTVKCLPGYIGGTTKLTDGNLIEWFLFHQGQQRLCYLALRSQRGFIASTVHAKHLFPMFL